MWPRFLRNPYFKFSGTALTGLCLSFLASAQTTPLETPTKTTYPGVLESLEKLIQIDTTKFTKKNDLLIKNGRALADYSSVTNIELDPDFLNSVILHSDPGYIRLASTNKCRFYDVILNDLLKSAEGKIKNVFITYINRNKERESAIVPRKDFLAKVVNLECPETQKLIDEFQVKNLDKTIRATTFEQPSGREQCRNIYLDWLSNARTPYYCKLHDYMKEARQSGGDPKDLQQRQAVARILEQKLNLAQRDYIENLCQNLDNEDLFCEEFLNVSFWSKIASGYENKIYAEDICFKLMNSEKLSDVQLKACLSRLKKENDQCLYPGGRSLGLLPYPQCDTLATALNYSSLRSDYRDCPSSSDQQAITNMGRILLNISKEPIPATNGPCSVISTGTTYEFNNKFNNDENWKLEACYDDRLAEKEVCQKTFFGGYGNSTEAYNVVVANILQKTRGTDQSLKCEMVDSEDYNPLLLQYKSGCYIIYERSQCFISQCKHKILLNDRVIDFIKLKNRAFLEYFPTSVNEERFSQNYILTHDFKQNGRSLNSLSSIVSFFKKSRRGIIHGVGCAEDILPSFFKSRSLNQCTPLPFIIDGLIRENDKTTFVTRTGVDSLQAPRLVSWSLIYSAVKSYQNSHPLRLWTLYALD